jgi:UDP-N-acetylglucosamine transferase subunit ALG13
MPVHFLGILSRLQTCSSPGAPGSILIIISGPEPQRTIFENILLRDLQSHIGKVVLVRGLPGTVESINVPAGVTVFNHANASTLNKLICEADIIISRSGYTTVMDIFKLRKKYIMVPTPGQPEQEFLGVYLHEKQLAYSVTQHSFSLSKVLTAVNSFSFRYLDDNMEDYKFVVREFVTSLKTSH